MAHQPVLADAVVDFLVPALEHGGVVVDATLGRGGHARALLDACPQATLIGIDRDPDAVRATLTHLAPYGGRVRAVRGDFQELATVLERLGVEAVRGILLDLGVSSPQLDDANRGFGFRRPGRLDMRMDPDQPLSAYDVVNRYPEAELSRVIRDYGEERFARRIAAAIVAARPIEDTQTLAAVVREAIPAATRRTGGHPARRTFQAIRIEVNGELDALERALPVAIDALEGGGRIVVISYHSLEDRIVKRAFADAARACTCPPEFPVCRCGAQPRLRLLAARPIAPSEQEMAANPRARSAKLRAAEKLEPVR